MTDEPHYIDPHGPEAKAMAADIWQRYVRDVADQGDVKTYGMDSGMSKFSDYAVVGDRGGAYDIMFEWNSQNGAIGLPESVPQWAYFKCGGKPWRAAVYLPKGSFPYLDEDNGYAGIEPHPVYYANPSGIAATEYKVLILPDPTEEKTKGGIIIPIDTVEKEKFAATMGTLIAASPLAFTYATDAEWQNSGAQKPKPGDRVIYEKYVGVRVKGPKDGVEYVLCNDRSIFATVES